MKCHNELSLKHNFLSSNLLQFELLQSKTHKKWWKGYQILTSVSA